MLTQSDIQELSRRGKTAEETEAQLALIAKGFAPAAVERAATVGDGIIAVDEAEAAKLAGSYEQALAAGLTVAKFVPASGAASRMFKPLHQFLAANAAEQEKLATEKPMSEFFGNVEKFAFGAQLEALKPKNRAEMVAKVLSDDGLQYGSHPKGLVAFHKYADGEIRTAAQEHIAEAEAYCVSKGACKLHYTVPTGMEAAFRAALKPSLDKAKANIELSFSVQDPATDVPALGSDGKPARNKEGHLIFRPGGHGALIGNLAKIDADLVFVKNIDNVAHGRMLAGNAQWKKVLAAIALQEKKAIDQLLLDVDNYVPGSLDRAASYIAEKLKIALPTSAKTDGDKARFVRGVLDRPLRVCGMVKNEGEPGGGPFWVKGADGNVTLQIVEGAQMDLSDARVAAIVKNSTHFNPVDLLCCLRDRNGSKYDLRRFVDMQACFRTQKSVGGIDVTGMELPGLWNGAMAGWLTFFVQVPVSTFTPVKTVFDLLRKEHQQ